MSNALKWRLVSKSFVQVVVLSALLLLPSRGFGQGVQATIDKLRYSEDFRLRVQAALDLGKSKSTLARAPLERALDDRNVAVRTAAAAALKALGDKRALAALRAHEQDSSAAVRTQIKTTISSLENADAGSVGQETSPARLLVKLGSIKNGTAVNSSSLVPRIEQASREKLGRLPGVRVVEESEDVNRAAKKKRLPAVMVTGRLRRLNASREGSEIVYSASVDYVVHSMPEQAILSTMSGSASAKASPTEARDERKMAELRALVLEAAIDSAMRRAGEALQAAMK